MTDKVEHSEYLASLRLCSHCDWTPDLKTMVSAGPDKMFGLPFEIPWHRQAVVAQATRKVLKTFGNGEVLKDLGQWTGKLWSRNITRDPETGIGGPGGPRRPSAAPEVPKTFGNGGHATSRAIPRPGSAARCRPEDLGGPVGPEDLRQRSRTYRTRR